MARARALALGCCPASEKPAGLRHSLPAITARPACCASGRQAGGRFQVLLSRRLKIHKPVLSKASRQLLPFLPQSCRLCAKAASATLSISLMKPVTIWDSLRKSMVRGFGVKLVNLQGL